MLLFRYLHHNQLTGVMPAQISALAALTSLYAPQNQWLKKLLVAEAF